MRALDARAALEELAVRRARVDLLSFCRYVWAGPGPFLVGQHTEDICRILTLAVDRRLAGEGSYIRIHTPPRHGKSVLCSTMLPAYFLGRCAQSQPSIISSGYGAKLVQSFSKDAKRILASPNYQRLFPGVLPAHGSDSVEVWQIAGSRGRVIAQGLEGSLTGHGGDLIVCDDGVKSAAEARSRAYRDASWDAFSANLMTRANGRDTIVLYVGTPWHVDDIGGRITRKSLEDKDFPKFEMYRFPATNPDGTFLWESRFGRSWYLSQYAMLGTLGPALLDCDPQPDGSGRFNPANIVWHDTLEGWPTVREVRGWDLASSTAQRGGADPDRTVGTRLGISRREGRDHVYVRSLECMRAEAPERNARIVEIAKADGAGVAQHIEAFGAFKDAYTELSTILKGIRTVTPSRMPGDKSAKAAPLEPVIAAGNLHIYRPGVSAEAQRLLNDELRSFPSGSHDDFVDSLAVAYGAVSAAGSSVLF